MYLEHYHLKRKPFGLTPGPDFFWFSEKHQEALATLKYGIVGDLGFLLLTGDVGVGKTALIHRLMSRLDPSTLVAHITDPGLGNMDFFRLLAAEFGIDTPFKSKGEFLIILERFLRQAHANQKKVLLIVDEAQRVNNVLLDQIRVLSNIELDDHKLINIFFVGQPEFKNMLMTSGNRAIRQRIAINYHVEPLTEDEIGQYIEHRLKIAGAARQIFKPNAISKIYHFSGGYPRAINIICDHALVTGYASGSTSIDSAIIAESEEELSIRSDFNYIKPAPPTPPEEIHSQTPPERRPTAWHYPAAVAASIVLIACLGYYFLWNRPSGTVPPDSIADSSLRRPASGLVQVEQPPPAMNNTENTVSLIRPREAVGSPDNAQKDGGRVADATGTGPEIAQLPPPPQVSISTRDDAIVREESPGAVAPPVIAVEQAPETGVQLSFAENAGSQLTKSGAVADDELPGEASPVADQPSTITEDRSAGEVEQAPLEDNAGNELATPDKAQEEADETNDSTQLADATDALPQGEPQTVPPPAEVAKPEPSPPQQESVVTDHQPADTPTDDSQAAIGTENVLAALTVLPESPPVPQADGLAQAGSATAGAAAKPLASETVKASDAAPSGSKTTASAPPAAPATSEATSIKPDPDTPPEEENLPPQNEAADIPAEPAIAATATLQPQEPENAKVTVETPEAGTLENRLRSFLQTYCTTYAGKDLDSFSTFFAPEAVENGKPFESLLPKYQKNFTFIDTIYYRIELEQFSYEGDGERVNIDGNFFLRWLPPDKKWRENAGKIFMSLEDNGSSFLVHRLDYHSNRPKDN